MSNKLNEIFDEEIDKMEKDYTDTVQMKLVKRDGKWLISKDDDIQKGDASI